MFIVTQLTRSASVRSLTAFSQSLCLRWEKWWWTRRSSAVSELLYSSTQVRYVTSHSLGSFIFLAFHKLSLAVFTLPYEPPVTMDTWILLALRHARRATDLISAAESRLTKITHPRSLSVSVWLSVFLHCPEFKLISVNWLKLWSIGSNCTVHLCS